MGDELSNDDIDALMNQMNGDGGDTGDTSDAGAEEAPSTEAASTLDIEDQLLELADNAMAVGASAWQTLLNKQVTMRRTTADAGNMRALLSEAMGNMVVAHVPTTGVIGAMSFVLEKSLAMRVISLMLMEDEAETATRAEKDFGEEEVDAFQEAINQACGSIGQAWRDALGNDVSFSPCRLVTGALPDGVAALEIPDEDGCVLAMDMEVEGEPGVRGWLLFDDALYQAWGTAAPAPPAEAPPTVGSGASTVNNDVGFSGTMESDMDRILSLDLPVRVLISEKKMTLSALTEIRPGSIIEFDKNCESVLDVFVNNQLLGRGEVVIKSERFGIQVKEIISLEERIRLMG